MDVFKIDKFFVSIIGMGVVISVVIDYIIVMVKSLNLFIVVEGVEILEQVVYLGQYGVDFVQGWLFVKFLLVGEFIDFYWVMLVDYGSGLESICSDCMDFVFIFLSV